MGDTDQARPALLPRDATGYGFTGYSEARVGGSLAVTAACSAGVFALAVGLVGRGWRLKP